MLRDGFDASEICKYLRYIDERIDMDSMRPVIKRVSERYFKRAPPDKRILKKSLGKQADRITRSEIVKYLTAIRKKKNGKVRRNWPLLKKEYPVLQELEKAYRYFHSCLNEKTATLIDKYIAGYKDCPISRIKTFAKGLARDLPAIKQGIITGITSGPVEGGNNKIKLVKRLGYGRMKYTRLKQKILSIANFFLP
jgi:transposase